MQCGANTNHRDYAGKIPFDYLRNNKDREYLEQQAWLCSQDGQAHLQSQDEAWNIELAELTAQCIPEIIDAAFNGDIGKCVEGDMCEYYQWIE